MKINKNELRVLVDVDGTLIKDDPSCTFQEFNYYNRLVYRIPMYDNIALVRAQKARGYEVIVHSANGWQWAEEVVNKLGLQDVVDEVASKPLKYLDDVKADEWMTRIFVSDK